MIEDPNLIKLQNEFEDLDENPMTDIGCQVWLKDDENYYEWEGMMQGPRNTPYKGAILYFTITFNKNDLRPEFRFSYKNMYHLNVSPQKGHVCINILNDWKPEKNIKIRDVIHSVNIILDKQNPDNPYHFEDDRVKLYKENREKFNEKVREWVRNNAVKAHK